MAIAVIARGAKRAVAIQLDCFVVSQSALLASRVAMTIFPNSF